MTIIVTRRALLGGMLCSAALAPALGLICPRTANGAAAALDPADPSAKEVAYTPDSAAISPAAQPTHQADQKCLNCQLFEGGAGNAAGTCDVFPGKTVASGGWCKVWAKRRGA